MCFSDQGTASRLCCSFECGPPPSIPSLTQRWGAKSGVKPASYASRCCLLSNKPSAELQHCPGKRFWSDLWSFSSVPLTDKSSPALRPPIRMLQHIGALFCPRPKAGMRLQGSAKLIACRKAHEFERKYWVINNPDDIRAYGVLIRLTAQPHHRLLVWGTVRNDRCFIIQVVAVKQPKRLVRSTIQEDPGQAILCLPTQEWTED